MGIRVLELGFFSCLIKLFEVNLGSLGALCTTSYVKVSKRLLLPQFSFKLKQTFYGNQGRMQARIMFFGDLSNDLNNLRNFQDKSPKLYMH